MLAQLAELAQTTLAAIAATQEPAALRALEIKVLGRKGQLTAILRELKNLPLAQRAAVGQKANEIKQQIQTALTAKTASLAQTRFASLAATEWLDPTANTQPAPQGTLHPLTKFGRAIEKVFTGLGFTLATGPEIEDDFHNFTALNIPAEHPARDAHDTLFLADSAKILRTQTSSVQIRWLENHPPPCKIIAPGRVFRKDDFDASHSPVFHQLEGLLVDREINLAHLKAVLTLAIRTLINPQAKFRFRTSYFPFVEPGLEVDMSCTICAGQGCSVCQRTGFVEVCGCGLVHPNVLRAVKIDPKQWSGFAFGFGVDRLLMLRYRINNLRLFFENDLRFLRQF